jgi:hypothetical protein
MTPQFLLAGGPVTDQPHDALSHGKNKAAPVTPHTAKGPIADLAIVQPIIDRNHRLGVEPVKIAK